MLIAIVGAYKAFNWVYYFGLEVVLAEELIGSSFA